MRKIIRKIVLWAFKDLDAPKKPTRITRFRIDDVPGGTGESVDVGYTIDGKNIRRDFPV